MSIVIDPEFSVFRLLERVKQSSTRISHRRTMSYISYEIENATLIDQAQGRIFAGFQRLSKFIPQIPRYERMAKHAEMIYVFGIPDTHKLPNIPNITYVHLTPDDQLAREWFLVSFGREYQSALATEEITNIDDPDETRIFNGLWTFETELVGILDEWLSSAVDAKARPYTEKSLSATRQAEIIEASILRLLTKTRRRADLTATQEIVFNEIKTVIKERVHPKLQEIDKRIAANSPQEREVTILFSDIRNFTKLSETMQPYLLVKQIINPYVDSVSKAVYRHGGVVDKLLGDGVLAVFGLENGDNQTADNALNAAVEIISDLGQRQHPIPIGIGIAKGRVLVGEVGGDQVYETTVIGDAVNVAQRLSQLGHNDIWVSQSVYEVSQQLANFESGGAVELKGKAQPHKVYKFRQGA